MSGLLFMIASYLIAILLVSPALTADACTSKVDQLTLFPKVEEELVWDLRQVFFQGHNLEYSLNDQTQQYFKLWPPVAQTGAETTHTADTVLSQKAWLDSRGVWLNSFVFLNQAADKVTIRIAESTEDKIRESPSFTKEIVVSADRAGNLLCFDVEYSTNKDQFVVDCQKEQIIQGTSAKVNVLYYVDQDGKATALPETEEAFYETTTRWLGQYSQTNTQGVTRKYLFRASPAFGIKTADGKLSKDSLIEAFIINDKGQPESTGYVLDALTLALISNKPLDFQFMLVDWRITPNGMIYLLDAQSSVFVVSYQPNGQWHLEKEIELPVGQAFAFDVNTLLKADGGFIDTMVILGYDYFVYFEDFQSVAVQDLSFKKLTYPAQIQLTQDFIVVRGSDNFYLYQVGSTDLLATVPVVAADHLLVNPFEPDLIKLTNKNATRHTLSQGYLKYSSANKETDQSAELVVTAKSGTATCQAKLTYQILKKDDFNLRQIGQNPFPKTITEGSPSVQLGALVSGPNPQYEQPKTSGLEQSSVVVDIKTRWNLNIKNAKLPNAADVIFGDVLLAQDPTKYFITLQTKDKKVEMWTCSHADIYSDSSECEKLASVPQAPVEFTSQTWQMWQDEDGTVMAMFQKDDFTISLSKVDGTTLKEIRAISYDKTVPSQKILSFTYLQYYFYVVKADGTVLCYNAREESEVVAIADNKTFLPYGYQGKWEPKRVFGNRKVKSNLVWIVNGDNIVLADVHGRFTYITSLAVTANAEIAVAPGPNTFYVIEGKTETNKAGKITEYDYERINNIFKTKDIYLYWYELQTPLNVDFASDTGYLFVRALCTKCNRTFVLAFKSDALQHDALFQAWPLSELIPDGTSVLISSQGTLDQMFLYVNDKKEHQIVSLLNRPVMLIKPNINQPEYSTKIDLNLRVYNYDGGNDVKYAQKVQVINTQTDVVINQDKFKPKNDEIDPKVAVVTRDLGNDWYNGQVTQFQIKCKQCNNGQIDIEQRVQKKKEGFFSQYVVYDFRAHSTSFNLVQAKNAILLAKPDGSLFTPVINLDLPTETYSCKQVQMSSNSLFLLSLCQDQTVYSLYLTSCVSVSECHPVGEVLKFPTNVAKIQLLTQDVLVVLYNDASNPGEGTIVVHKIEQGIDSWTFPAVLTINAQTFQVTSFKPVDFQIAKWNTKKDGTTQTDIFKLVISDAAHGLYFHDFSYDSNMQFLPLKVGNLNLNEFLNSDEAGQYAQPDTQFWQLRVIKSEYKDRVLTQHLFIQTSNVAHYILSLTFQADDTETSATLQTQAVQVVINRYGDWKAINRISISQAQLALPYIKGNQVVVGVYALPKAATAKENLRKCIGTASSVAANAPVLTMIGAFSFTSNETPNPLDMALHFENADFYVSEPNKSLNQFSVNDQPKLVITTKGLTSDTVELMVTNDFKTSQPVKLEIKVKPDNPPGPDPEPQKSSSNLWWIILIIVGVLLILGIGGFIFFKKRKNAVDDEERPLV